jgi:hypothetical protein
MTTMSADSCERCVVAAAGRRAFLRDIGLAVVGTLALSATPAAVLAESVAELAPAGVLGASRTYEIPKTDSVAVDEPNGVILARWENRVYAFSMKCPHRAAGYREGGLRQCLALPTRSISTCTSLSILESAISTSADFVSPVCDRRTAIDRRLSTCCCTAAGNT